MHKENAWIMSGSSHPGVLLGKDILKICSKFTGEHQYCCNFIEIILRHGWSPVNLLHFFNDNMNNGENVKGTMLIASRLVIDRMVASTITSTGGPKINDKMIKWNKLRPARNLMILKKSTRLTLLLIKCWLGYHYCKTSFNEERS